MWRLSATSSAESVRPVVIVGGGISGLVVAFRLARRGIRSTLIEKSEQLGGLIRTDRWGGCDLEAGPDSFIADKPALAELAAELGIDSQLIGSNDGARRTFIAKNGRLIPMPPGMVLMVPSDLRAANASELFSPASKQRFEAELLFTPRTREIDIPLRDFVSDHFGSDVFDTLAEPLLAGVYGGNGSLLSARSVLPKFIQFEQSTGSLIRAVQAERQKPRTNEVSVFRSFAGGMQTVIDALRAAIHPFCEILHGKIRTADPVTPGTWRLHFDDGRRLEGRQLVLACPAHTQAAILTASTPLLAAHLADIPYSSAILATYVYDCGLTAPALDGFGFLVPQAERRTIAAATFISTKFPSRIPPNFRAIRAFVVGRQAEALAGFSENVLLSSIKSDLERFVQIEGAPVFHKLDRWPASMPQYVVGHEARCQQISILRLETPNLHLCGNAFEGVGLPDCVRLATQTAERIEAACGKPSST